MGKNRLIVVTVLFVAALVACTQTSQLISELDSKWQSIAFGQSTDLNFSSTILPEKIGVNGALADNPGTLNGKIVVESRGGKVAAAHDGIAFYYTVLDSTRYNFVLEADILVEQFGPETSAAPNSQTACGLMVRDVNGSPRKEPMEFGYEELPAASNFAATAFFSNSKTHLNACAVTRNGIRFPFGNQGSTLTVDAFRKGLSAAQWFHLKLERTDADFIMTCSDLDGGNAVSKQMSGVADIVQVCEKDKMYVGFFAARNAKMVVSNARLSTSPASTKPGAPYKPKTIDQYFELESSDGSASDNYLLMMRSGYDGTVDIARDGYAVLESGSIKAGDFYKFNASLMSGTTRFDVTFTPTQGPGQNPITRSITVEKRNLLTDRGLVVAPNGRPEATGTVQDPLDLATAVRFVQPGETILLRGGNYGTFSISRLYSGLEGKLKKLMPYDNDKVVFAGLSSQASFWHIYGIESTASKGLGFRIQGNNNIIERCTAHDNQSTGFQMDSPIKIPALKTSHNLFLNCDSYDNMDPAMMNADGFAAKSSVGKGNVYRGCISHHNVDDGWDLYNNIQEGPNEPVLIEYCITYQNGNTTRGQTGGGTIGNGFKLGGEGLPVPHVVRNCIAFNNRMDGLTCNFNPGGLVVENCTSFDNTRCNFIFRSNPYIKPAGKLTNNISFRTESGSRVHDFVAGSSVEYNLFYRGENNGVTAADFVSISVPSAFARDERGGIVWGDFLRLAPASSLLRAGKNAGSLGALTPVK